MSRYILAVLLLICPALHSLLAAPQTPLENRPPAPSAEEEINKSLDQPAALDFREAPLKQVVATLAGKLGRSVVVDRKALADVGIDADEQRITFSSQEVRLRAALWRMLGELELTFTIRDEALVITTPENVHSRLTQRVYSLAPFTPDVPPDEQAEHQRQLREVVLATVAPMTWDDVGGPGAASIFAGQLVVSQAAEVHEEIGELFELLAEAKRRAEKAPAGPLAVAPLTWESPAVRKLRAKLEEPSALTANELPLSEALALLAARHKIPIELNRKSLADFSVDPNEPISCKLSGLSLRALLKHVLGELDLIHVVRHEVLLVTAMDSDCPRMRTHLHPIGDLARLELAVNPVARPPFAEHRIVLPPRSGAEELIELIQEQVAPTTWEHVGGPGAIRALASPPVLVVSNDDGVQREIADLLAKLREKLPAKPPAPRPVERIYLLTPPADLPAAAEKQPFPSAAELARLVPEVVEPDGWKTPGVWVKAVSGRLIVRHYPATQRRIERLLAELRVIDPLLPEGTMGQERGGGGLGGNSLDP